MVTASSQAVEVERSSGARRPAVVIELVQPVFISNLDGVLALGPRQVVDKLPAIDRFEAESDPLHAELSVRDIACERDIRGTRGLIHDAALIRTPEAILPVQPGRN